MVTQSLSLEGKFLKVLWEMQGFSMIGMNSWSSKETGHKTCEGFMYQATTLTCPGKKLIQRIRSAIQQT